MIQPTFGENVILLMKDPKNCGGCMLSDPFNMCCKAVKKEYANNNLIGNSKPDFCPLHPLVREPRGNFTVVDDNGDFQFYKYK